DADDAILQRLGYAPYARVVAGVEIRGQAEDGVVGLLQHFFFGVELEQRRNGAEGFFNGETHRRRDIAHNGRLEERTAQGVRLAAGDDLGALLDGIGDVFLHLVHGVAVDQRTLGHAFVEAVADLHGLDLGGQALDDFFVDARLDVDAVGADASLAGVAVLGRQDADRKSTRLNSSHVKI